MFAPRGDSVNRVHATPGRSGGRAPQAGGAARRCADLRDAPADRAASLNGGSRNSPPTGTEELDSDPAGRPEWLGSHRRRSSGRVSGGDRSARIGRPASRGTVSPVLPGPPLPLRRVTWSAGPGSGTPTA